MDGKSSIACAIERLKSLPWRQLFYMFYIEPIVFTLIFSHLLSGENNLTTFEIQVFENQMDYRHYYAK